MTHREMMVEMEKNEQAEICFGDIMLMNESFYMGSPVLGCGPRPISRLFNAKNDTWTKNTKTECYLSSHLQKCQCHM